MLFSRYFSVCRAARVRTNGFRPSTAPKPLLQDLKVYTNPAPAGNSDDPLVRKTGSSEAVSATRAISADPVIADVTIPGYSGILRQTLDGKTIVESCLEPRF